MLNRAKLMQALEGVTNQLFIDTTQAHTLARELWHKISTDATFIYKVKASHAPWPLPTWQGNLSDAIAVAPSISNYHVLSVDGSQIYPDRHQGLGCFLINIGSVMLHYGCPNKAVQFDSVPQVFTGHEKELYEIMPHDLVNCRRQEMELDAGFALSVQLNKLCTDEVPRVLLFDGSLIFWHLEAKDDTLRTLFLHKYLATLHGLYEEQMPTAGYVSLPRSRELVNLLRLALCNFDAAHADKTDVLDGIVDATVASFFLRPFERTIVFQNHAHINQYYPEPLKPYFFYLHVGNEIGRVEVPAWIAHDQQLVNVIAQVIIDQCTKGRGYPVVLAEAHEQAVVKGPDRDFFYHLLHKIGIDNKQRIALSQKVIKKRGIGI
ncbi:MAG TPA: DNA double-strand break repair nuclease NurA [Candidatus Dependentiae bacterium]|nr:DNA double-strand break repair nuclease NurA [Candidatus Dependentiae bacterium]HRQ62661.1 DNA double-strand break repair nuclease NurA [Candidatus Dependentiae bacterium]